MQFIRKKAGWINCFVSSVDAGFQGEESGSDAHNSPTW